MKLQEEIVTLNASCSSLQGQNDLEIKSLNAQLRSSNESFTSMFSAMNESIFVSQQESNILREQKLDLFIKLAETTELNKVNSEGARITIEVLERDLRNTVLEAKSSEEAWSSRFATSELNSAEAISKFEDFQKSSDSNVASLLYKLNDLKNKKIHDEEILLQKISLQEERLVNSATKLGALILDLATAKKHFQAASAATQEEVESLELTIRNNKIDRNNSESARIVERDNLLSTIDSISLERDGYLFEVERMGRSLGHTESTLEAFLAESADQIRVRLQEKLIVEKKLKRESKVGKRQTSVVHEAGQNKDMSHDCVRRRMRWPWMKRCEDIATELVQKNPQLATRAQKDFRWPWINKCEDIIGGAVATNAQLAFPAYQGIRWPWMN
jgi:hypothetical protein